MNGDATLVSEFKTAISGSSLQATEETCSASRGFAQSSQRFFLSRHRSSLTSLETIWALQKDGSMHV
jgi:hypothetical protein